jgi:hypothetical protein
MAARSDDPVEEREQILASLDEFDEDGDDDDANDDDDDDDDIDDDAQEESGTATTKAAAAGSLRARLRQLKAQVRKSHMWPSAETFAKLNSMWAKTVCAGTDIVTVVGVASAGVALLEAAAWEVRTVHALVTGKGTKSVVFDFVRRNAIGMVMYYGATMATQLAVAMYTFFDDERRLPVTRVRELVERVLGLLTCGEWRRRGGYAAVNDSVVEADAGESSLSPIATDLFAPPPDETATDDADLMQAEYDPQKLDKKLTKMLVPIVLYGMVRYRHKYLKVVGRVGQLLLQIGRKGQDRLAAQTGESLLRVVASHAVA